MKTEFAKLNEKGEMTPLEKWQFMTNRFQVYVKDIEKIRTKQQGALRSVRKEIQELSNRNSTKNRILEDKIVKGLRKSVKKLGSLTKPDMMAQKMQKRRYRKERSYCKKIRNDYERSQKKGTLNRAIENMLHYKVTHAKCHNLTCQLAEVC